MSPKKCQKRGNNEKKQCARNYLYLLKKNTGGWRKAEILEIDYACPLHACFHAYTSPKFDCRASSIGQCTYVYATNMHFHGLEGGFFSPEVKLAEAGGMTAWRIIPWHQP